MGKEFEIWATGYVATGESGTAQKIGTSKGKSFDDAVKNFKTKHPNFEIEQDNKGRWYVWACYLYDNESDARKNFG